MTCQANGCNRPARCALHTRRPTRDKLTTTIYYDDRTAPKAAVRYCKEHGRETAHGLMQIVDNDEEASSAAVGPA